MANLWPPTRFWQYWALSGMVVLTAAAGFYLASPGPLDVALLLHTLVGTALVAQVWAPRTEDRQARNTGQYGGAIRHLFPGLNNTEVARALVISTHTARHHTEKVLQKLGVRSRHDVPAAVAARRNIGSVMALSTVASTPVGTCSHRTTPTQT